MNQEIFRKIKEHLESKRARLLRELSSQKIEESELDRVDSQAEMVDIAQGLEELSRTSSLKEQELKELQAVELTLKKMGTPLYGFCEDCEDEIPEKRLLAVPQTFLCARCQALRERDLARQRIA